MKLLACMEWCVNSINRLNHFFIRLSTNQLVLPIYSHSLTIFVHIHFYIMMLPCSNILKSGLLLTSEFKYWYNRILDFEVNIKRTSSIDTAIYNSITRQQLDGALSLIEVEQLRFVHHLWIELRYYFLQLTRLESDSTRQYIRYLLLTLHSYGDLTYKTLNIIFSYLSREEV